ncbi:hypothetical protein GGR52DRAFT_130175 [Hypoxylon sp. FL1284]|nr:hypothetical protein GGR52DRAFT_130175 [Hypoxylon sp. FL1284]
MPSSPRFPTPATAQLLSGECSLPLPNPQAASMPSKRSDDDIQIISCKPVKRRKLSNEASEPVPQQQCLPAVPVASLAPIAMPPPEPRDTERRISTGMVGLPSDFGAMDLTCSLRGASLPVLDNFALDQPFRKPRALSPPELSPTQLPHTIARSSLIIGANENGTSLSTTGCVPTACMSAGESLAGPGVSPSSPRSAPDLAQLHIVEKPPAQGGLYSTVPVATSPKEASLSTSAMLPAPLPVVDAPTATNAARDGAAFPNAQFVTRPDLANQPCQVCARMRQQASITKSQALLMHHNIPHHIVPQMAHHQPYGQHMHPHMMAMGQNNAHGFGPGFGPFMVPMGGSPFAGFPPRVPKPAPVDQQSDVMDPKLSPNASVDSHQPLSTSGVGFSESATVSNPVRPPASLIQPTYRKPSPNLIVDVAETCQEKFPFEEVARRHNVPIEKVFDVFAAIIQVPLLRCPTDRRRAGKLATARVREYTKAKRAVQQTIGQAGSDRGGEIALEPLEIANHLGEVNFPNGFDPPGL